MERRVFEEVTAPILPETSSYLRNSCRDPKMQVIEEENPYEQFLIRRFKKTIEDSKMIIICHLLPCSGVQMREIRIDFKLQGLQLHKLNNNHMGMTIEGTDKANLSYLLCGDNMIICSPEIKLKEAWTVLKKTSVLVPLGGYCHDRLFTKDQLQEFSKLPPIELLLGELVSCLNLAAGGRTSALLNSHQQTLSTNLQQYHKQKSEET